MRYKIKQIKRIYGHFHRDIYIVFFAKLINSLGAFVFPLLTLILTKKLGLSKKETGIWIAAAGIIYAMASILGGKLADNFGRKKIIVIFNMLGASVYIICGLMPESFELIYLIMAACVLMIVADPALNALVADITKPSEREGAYSLIYLGSNVGYAIGPAIAGMLFENHLNLIFIGDAVTAIISTLLLLIFVKESINKTEDEHISREKEKRVEGSLKSVLLDRKILIYFSLVLFGYYFVYSQWGFLVPLHMENLYPGHGASFFGKLTIINGLTVIVATPLITSYFRGISNLLKIFFAGLLYVVGFGTFAFVDFKLGFLILVVIITLGEVTITTNCMPFIASHSPASHRGRINSVIPIIMGAGYVIGPFVMGWFVKYKSFASAWKFIGIFMFIFASLMLWLEILERKKRKKNRKTRKDV
ncbi:MFS transporter [Clostridiaceae bacterium M8S5]|nr:MFS transporter [Clostridiaceae bacterium M8S5]